MEAILELGKSIMVNPPYSWFSRDIIAVMMVSHEQKISH
jgi:hypothetical protein